MREKNLHMRRKWNQNLSISDWFSMKFHKDFRFKPPRFERISAWMEWAEKEWNTIPVKEMMAMLACLEFFLSLNLLCDLGHFIQLLEFNKARYNLCRVYIVSITVFYASWSFFSSKFFNLIFLLGFHKELLSLRPFRASSSSQCRIL
jgi:hypothetical protein